ncbi:lipoprotein [Maricaulaceae bacterium NA33B04]|nr:lipoprotein [Maricaulaceae bacterium NA33B04]
MRRLISIITALGAVLILGACGVRGDLERPPPVWGEDQRTDEERAYEDEGDGETEGEAELR